MTTYDYIIVGAGAAGCVLANRLSEDPSNQVLLLEFGGSDVNPLHFIPKGFFFTLRGDRYSYHYPTQPVGPGGQRETWTRGKVTGGSTTINGMMYIRGAAADYDAIVERGNPGWGWQDMLPTFKTMEDHGLGPSDTRGAGGPLGVCVTEQDELVSNAIRHADPLPDGQVTVMWDVDGHSVLIRVTDGGASSRPRVRHPSWAPRPR